MKKIGMALSGGGARGIAHLGALQALEENWKFPSSLSGTSAGAIAAAFYAAGNRPWDIMKIFKESNYFGLSHLLIGQEGVFDLEGLRELLETHIPFRRFEELPVPIFVAATDLTANRSFIFRSGPLIEPILASSCVPFIFQPVVLEGKEWVDGGILNNFPIEPLLQHCNIVIGSHVNRLNTGVPLVHGKMSVLDRCFHMAVAAPVYEKSSACTVFLDPPGLCSFGMFDVKKAESIFDIGYRHCMLHSKELQSLAAETHPHGARIPSIK